MVLNQIRLAESGKVLTGKNILQRPYLLNNNYLFLNKGLNIKLTEAFLNSISITKTLKIKKQYYSRSTDNHF